MEQAETNLASKKTSRAKLDPSKPFDESVLLSSRETERVINQEKVTIVINDRRDKSEPETVFVGVNGHKFFMKRGTEIKVPRAVCNVLDESLETKYMTQTGSDGKTHMTAHQVLSYPYRIVHNAPQT